MVPENNYLPFLNIIFTQRNRIRKREKMFEFELFELNVLIHLKLMSQLSATLQTRIIGLESNQRNIIAT